MQRLLIPPRGDWQATIESQGMSYHAIDGEEFWQESAYYQFTSTQIDEIEKATYALNEMCLKVVQHVIDKNLFGRFGIPGAFVDFVRQSWERDELTIYGRFDLAYSGAGPPKLLEFNADTPTALLEAAVIQWYWFKDVFPKLDQFNSIHERLIEAWKKYEAGGETLYFMCLSDNLEDYMTTSYLRDTAMQAGQKTEFIPIEQVGWNEGAQAFLDLKERPIRHAFKLYPWEWLLREQFGPQLLRGQTRWLEAPWKMILSNKAILPILYELFPESPYLLEASFQPLSGSFVRKPIYSREGANVQMIEDGKVVFASGGDYSGPYVYQRTATLPRFGEVYPVVGSWMVNGYACGIGIREDRSPITRNTSCFVPHVFTPTGA